MGSITTEPYYDQGSADHDRGLGRRLGGTLRMRVFAMDESAPLSASASKVNPARV